MSSKFLFFLFKIFLKLLFVALIPGRVECPACLHWTPFLQRRVDGTWTPGWTPSPFPSADQAHKHRLCILRLHRIAPALEPCLPAGGGWSYAGVVDTVDSIVLMGDFIAHVCNDSVTSKGVIRRNFCLIWTWVVFNCWTVLVTDCQ